MPLPFHPSLVEMEFLLREAGVAEHHLTAQLHVEDMEVRRYLLNHLRTGNWFGLSDGPLVERLGYLTGVFLADVCGLSSPMETAHAGSH